MKSRNAVIAFAFIPVILAVTWFMFLRSPIPDIDQETAQQLAAAADSLYPKWAGKTVPESEWPPAIKSLWPKSVRVEPGGVYLMKEQRGQGERGVFIHLSVAATLPPPDFRLICDPVYWYEIKG